MVAQAAAASSSGEGAKTRGRGGRWLQLFNSDADLDHASNTDNDDDDVKYCNYWTGGSFKAYGASRHRHDPRRQEAHVSSDSFCYCCIR